MFCCIVPGVTAAGCSAMATSIGAATGSAGASSARSVSLDKVGRAIFVCAVAYTCSSSEGALTSALCPSGPLTPCIKLVLTSTGVKVST